jgi:hypothetical protein
MMKMTAFEGSLAWVSFCIARSHDGWYTALVNELFVAVVIV